MQNSLVIILCPGFAADIVQLLDLAYAMVDTIQEMFALCTAAEAGADLEVTESGSAVPATAITQYTACDS